MSKNISRRNVFSRIAAAGLLSSLFLLPGNTPSDEETLPKLFASPQTKLALGKMAHYLPQWADMDILVITDNDLRDHGYDTENHETSSAAAFESYCQTISGFPFDRIEREGFSGRYLRSVTDSSPVGFPLPARAEGERDVCAITIPDLDRDRKRYVISKISGMIGGSELNNVPGTSEEWVLLVIAHETGHARHNISAAEKDNGLTAMLYEVEADQHGIDIYMRDAEDILGRTIDDKTAVPSALIAMRGINSLTSFHLHHANSAGLSISGAYNALTTNHQDLAKERQATINAIRSFVKDGVADRNKKTRSRPSPLKLYSAAKRLFDEGYFDETPVQRRYVETFLRGAEDLFPKHFRVDRYVPPEVSLTEAQKAYDAPSLSRDF